MRTLLCLGVEVVPTYLWCTGNLCTKCLGVEVVPRYLRCTANTCTKCLGVEVVPRYYQAIFSYLVSTDCMLSCRSCPPRIVWSPLMLRHWFKLRCQMRFKNFFVSEQWIILGSYLFTPIPSFELIQIGIMRGEFVSCKDAFHALRPENLWRGVGCPVGVTAYTKPKLYSLAYWGNKM